MYYVVRILCEYNDIFLKLWSKSPSSLGNFSQFWLWFTFSQTLKNSLVFQSVNLERTWCQGHSRYM